MQYAVKDCIVYGVWKPRVATSRSCSCSCLCRRVRVHVHVQFNFKGTFTFTFTFIKLQVHVPRSSPFMLGDSPHALRSKFTLALSRPPLVSGLYVAILRIYRVRWLSQQQCVPLSAVLSPYYFSRDELIVYYALGTYRTVVFVVCHVA